MGAVVRALPVGHRRERRSLDQHLAGVDRVEPRQAVQECRLAAAARPHDRDHLATLECEVDAAKRLDTDHTRLVGPANGTRFDNGCDACCLPGERRLGARFGDHGHFLSFDVLSVARQETLDISDQPDRCAANYGASKGSGGRTTVPSLGSRCRPTSSTKARHGWATHRLASMWVPSAEWCPAGSCS